MCRAVASFTIAIWLRSVYPPMGKVIGDKRLKAALAASESGCMEEIRAGYRTAKSIAVEYRCGRQRRRGGGDTRLRVACRTDLSALRFLAVRRIGGFPALGEDFVCSTMLAALWHGCSRSAAYGHGFSGSSERGSFGPRDGQYGSVGLARNSDCLTAGSLFRGRL